MSKQFFFKQFSLAQIHSLNTKNSQVKKPRFSSIWPIDRTFIRCYRSGLEWTWEQRRGTLHSQNLLHHWNLTNWLFSVISRTLVGEGVLLHCREPVGIFCSPSRLGQISNWFSSKYAMVRVAYVCGSEGLDIVNFNELEVVIKDHFYTIYNHFFC